MKGIMFTITVFIIMGFAIAYFALNAFSNIERANFANEKLAAQRVFYTWMGISDNFQALLNVSIGKNDTIAEFNDSLPATSDKINSMMTRFQQFVDQYIEDPTISIRFEDASGQETTLDYAKNSQIVIKPMNINYSWPTNGKNRLFIKVNPVNFSYIRNISIYIKMKNVDFDCKPPNPSSSLDCERWNPDSTVSDCTGVEYCLYLDLTFEDQQGRVFNFGAKKFDVDDSPTKKSTDNLNIKNSTSAYSIDIQVGSLPTVIDIDLHNTKVDTFTKLNLTTSQFYIDFPTKLNVSSDFGKKVDFV